MIRLWAFSFVANESKHLLMLVAVSSVALCFLVPPAPSMRVRTAPTSLRVAPLSMSEAAAAGGVEELCDIMPASVCEEVCSRSWFSSWFWVYGSGSGHVVRARGRMGVRVREWGQS